MLVFNISKLALTYRKRLIQPGESFDFPDLKTVPARDELLVRKKVLAFGSLPLWYVLQKQAPITPPAPTVSANVTVKAEPQKKTAVEEAPKREFPKK